MVSRWANSEEEEKEDNIQDISRPGPKGLAASKWAHAENEEQEEQSPEKSSPQVSTPSPKQNRHHQNRQKTPSDHNVENPHMGQAGMALAHRLTPQDKKPEKQQPDSDGSPTRSSKSHTPNRNRAREAAHEERERNRLRKLNGPKLDWNKDDDNETANNDKRGKGSVKSNSKSNNNGTAAKEPPQEDVSPSKKHLTKEEQAKLFKDLSEMSNLDWGDDDDL